MRSFVVQKDPNWGNYGGYGCGYCLIPINNKYFNEYEAEQLLVHGGITFNKIVSSEVITQFHLSESERGKRIVGFDTYSSSMNEINCPKEYVLAQVKALEKQIFSKTIKDKLK